MLYPFGLPLYVSFMKCIEESKWTLVKKGGKKMETIMLINVVVRFVLNFIEIWGKICTYLRHKKNPPKG